METIRSPNRGSYLWGRSVHNTRIECLWVDVKKEFVNKWQEFFLRLSTECGLVPEYPDHIWLLHHVFLDQINQEAEEWCSMWNEHPLSIQGVGNDSPALMYALSPSLHGLRGWELDDIEDVEQDYGVEHERLLRAVRVEGYSDDTRDGANDVQEIDPLSRDDHRPIPSNISYELPNCPLTSEKVEIFDYYLHQAVDMQSQDEEMCVFQWLEVIRLYRWVLQLPNDVALVAHNQA
ncbi:hypothetical protein AN958_08783 [Leucoagaricus sp. SymC.cos]|nr:hypothetical protein AN958_08783 [Leucoagaricus sp. SymC.cos]